MFCYDHQLDSIPKGHHRKPFKIDPWPFWCKANSVTALQRKYKDYWMNYLFIYLCLWCNILVLLSNWWYCIVLMHSYLWFPSIFCCCNNIPSAASEMFIMFVNPCRSHAKNVLVFPTWCLYHHVVAARLSGSCVVWKVEMAK